MTSEVSYVEEALAEAVERSATQYIALGEAIPAALPVRTFSAAWARGRAARSGIALFRFQPNASHARFLARRAYMKALRTPLPRLPSWAACRRAAVWFSTTPPSAPSPAAQPVVCSFSPAR